MTGPSPTVRELPCGLHKEPLCAVPSHVNGYAHLSRHRQVGGGNRKEQKSASRQGVAGILEVAALKAA